MIIDPTRVTNVNTDFEKIDNRIEKITSDMISYLIERYSDILGKSVEVNNKEAIEKIVRERITRDYNYSNIDVEELINRVLDRVFGYSILQKYIDEPDISDIRVVKWNVIHVMRNGKWEHIDESFSSEVEFYNFVRYCVLKNHGRITYENPIVVVSDRENHLRIEAGISPVNVLSPSLVIRIHRPGIMTSLSELYLKKSMMNKDIYDFLVKASKAGLNIIIAGKGGSGKTTLLRGIINEIPEDISITSNEETAEIFSTHKNIIQREITKNRERKNIQLEDLTRQALVMSNDAIVVGELKGGEAMYFFDAISTGHRGYATVHADSAGLVIDRLVNLMKRNQMAYQYGNNYLKDLLAQSVDLIIYMRYFKIQEVCEVIYENEEIRYNKLFEFDIESLEDGKAVGQFKRINEYTSKIKYKMDLYQ